MGDLLKNKARLVKLLVDDFKNMFPEASRNEVILLNLKLSLMPIESLGLLVSQLKDV
jgi:hypothetical protein